MSQTLLHWKNKKNSTLTLSKSRESMLNGKASKRESLLKAEKRSSICLNSKAAFRCCSLVNHA